MTTSFTSHNRNLLGRAADFVAGVGWALLPRAIKEDIRVLQEIAELDEPGWLPLMTSGEFTTLTGGERTDAQQAMTYYAERDPVASRAMGLKRDYTFGRGVSSPSAADDQVQEVVSAFWNDPENRKSIGRARAQWSLADRLYKRGEVFFVLFVNCIDGSVMLRVLEDDTEIKEILRHPGDATKNLYYKRQWTEAELDLSDLATSGTYTKTTGKTRNDWYCDWHNRTGEYADKGVIGQVDEHGQPLTRIYMHHLKLGDGTRGIPPDYPAISWIKALRGFLEDRITLVYAQAVFAFRQKIAGGQTAVQRLVARWGSLNIAKKYATGGKERREGGQTLIESGGSELEPMYPKTGASEAQTDGRMIRHQICAGTGITEPDLFGDASTGNLATLSAMNAPMLKGFESWQQLWQDEFKDILEFVVDMARLYNREFKAYVAQVEKTGEEVDTSVDINFPPIVTRDMSVALGALATILTTQANAGIEVMTPRRFAAEILSILGETDVDSALEQMDLPDHFPQAAPGVELTTEPGDAEAETFKMLERILAKVEHMKDLQELREGVYRMEGG